MNIRNFVEYDEITPRWMIFGFELFLKKKKGDSIYIDIRGGEMKTCNWNKKNNNLSFSFSSNDI